MNHYYTYIYLDPSKPGIWKTSFVSFLFEPFYVGKGQGDRLYFHLTDKRKNHKCHKISKIIKNGLQPVVLKIHENQSEIKALENESILIKEIGTGSLIEGAKIGPLTNLKLDGSIQKYSIASKQLMSESAKSRPRQPHSKETIEKMKNSNANKDPKKRAAISAALTGIKRSKEQCDFLSKLHKGKTISAKQREQISKALRGRKRSVKVCVEQSIRQSKTWNIVVEKTNEIITVNNLQKWCDDNIVNYSTLYGTIYRNKFHKGYKLLPLSDVTPS
jgi:hypothetical protein